MIRLRWPPSIYKFLIRDLLYANFHTAEYMQIIMVPILLSCKELENDVILDKTIVIFRYALRNTGKTIYLNWRNVTDSGRHVFFFCLRFFNCEMSFRFQKAIYSVGALEFHVSLQTANKSCWVSYGCVSLVRFIMQKKKS